MRWRGIVGCVAGLKRTPRQLSPRESAPAVLRRVGVFWPIDGPDWSRLSFQPTASSSGSLDGSSHPPWPQGVTFAVPGTAKCPGVVFPLPVVSGMWA